jgi:hypothetical protein
LKDKIKVVKNDLEIEQRAAETRLKNQQLIQQKLEKQLNNSQIQQKTLAKRLAKMKMELEKKMTLYHPSKNLM